MSKKDLLLTAMAGMLAASNEYDTSSIIGERAKKDSRLASEKKKCKSCKHFCKISDGRCVCDIYARMDYQVYPLAVACSKYIKRSKRL